MRSRTEKELNTKPRQKRPQQCGFFCCNCSTPILAEDDLVKYYLQALSKILENKEKCISACRAKMNKADALEKIRQKRIKAETDLARNMEKIQALVKENAYISQDQQVYRK